MAQRTEKEETEVKVPETLTLCINNCGVTGNPATNNMCQKCFSSTTATSSSSSSSSAAGDVVGGLIDSISKKTPRSSLVRSPDRTGTSPAASIRRNREADAASEEKKCVNRCSGCRRKVGLTGFRCRCGELFCAEHRYSDRHDCSYDYKAAGREAIARENPVVKPAKILKV